MRVTSVLMLVTGCATAQLELSERETTEILDDLSVRVRDEQAAARDADAPAGRSERLPIEVPKVLGLQDALRIAAGMNRDLLSSREGLTLSALTLRNARRDVGPRVSGSVDYLLTGSEDDESRRSSGGTLSLTDLLPTGGDVTLSADANRAYGRGDVIDSSASGDVELRLRQPLLRGAGYESSHEALTDAERQALYDVRGFELSRQDLALRVQREYYALVAQKQVIGNRELSLENFAFLRRRSEALFEVGRVSEVDKFRATREFLSAENALVDTRQEFETRLDRFKVLLSLDTDTAFEIAAEIPDPPVEDVDLASALQLALRNRLELMTARDQVEDAERRLRIAERELLPDLDVEALRRRSSITERRVRDVRPDVDDYSVGLSLELPFDRVRERGALRGARISLDRARRSLAQAEDDVILSVRESVRDLRSAQNSLAIQKQIVTSEEKNARVARLRFEQGEIGNRDLTDALIGLADARDRFVRELANVENARTQLRRDLGVLALEEDGTWAN